MPLPLWLIPLALKGAAVVAGAAGVGSAVHGASKMKDAKDTMEIASACSDAYIKEHFAGIDSVRLSYLFGRNKRELEMVVTELWQELKAVLLHLSG